MNPVTIRIARRLATYMLSVAEQQIDMNFFMGMGMTLAVCYEEMTGNTARDKKPQHLLEWAMALPDEKYPRVIL